jgi:hypothetical protein
MAVSFVGEAGMVLIEPNDSFCFKGQFERFCVRVAPLTLYSHDSWS